MVSVAFFGSHPLGEACLTRLHDHPDVEVSVVVTYPRDYDGWWDGSVHDLALDYSYPVLTIDEEDRVTEYDVDYLLSVYYPNILGGDLLSHPRKAAINLHQAELPRYRGSNVFSHSIMNARDDDYWRHGTTMHFMVEEVDAGAVVARKFAEITEEDTARSLYEKTREASIELFEEQLPHIVDDSVLEMGTPQDEFDGPRYFYTKASLDDLKVVDPDELADPADSTALYDRIRAMDFPPHEPPYMTVGGEKIYLTTSGYGN